MAENQRFFESVDVEPGPAARVPTHSPEWTDHNDSDPGIAARRDFGSGMNEFAFAPLSASDGKPSGPVAAGIIIKHPEPIILDEPLDVY